jgi:hypothetical protein
MVQSRLIGYIPFEGKQSSRQLQQPPQTSRLEGGRVDGEVQYVAQDTVVDGDLSLPWIDVLDRKHHLSLDRRERHQFFLLHWFVVS